MTHWRIRIREINMENIQIGKVVVVRDSFLTEDEKDLKGQKGIVRMLYDADPTDDQTRDEVMVEWTPETLDSFEDDYFYDAFDEEISWTSYILPTEVGLEKAGNLYQTVPGRIGQGWETHRESLRKARRSLKIHAAGLLAGLPESISEIPRKMQSLLPL